MLEESKRETDLSYYTYHVGREDYKPNSKKLVWNVFIEDINQRKIIPYNIFDHGSFYNGLCRLNKNLNKEVELYRNFLESEVELRKRLQTLSKTVKLEVQADPLPVLEKKLKDFDKLSDDQKAEKVFKERVRKDLSYYFWSKSEWEVIVTSWPPYVDSEEIDRLVKEREEHISKWGKFYQTHCNVTLGEKVDVYTQVMLNWDQFISYLWNNRKLIKTVSKRGR